METSVRVSEVRVDGEQLAPLAGDSDPWSSGGVGEARWMGAHSYKVWRPPTDVYETDESVVVKVEIAGLKEGEFEVSLANRVLTIFGSRRESAAKLSYQQMEIRYGRFLTEVRLPCSVEAQRTEAVYEDGFLRVTLPKVPRRRVNVVETH
jgi:HSP20 family protein